MENTLDTFWMIIWNFTWAVTRLRGSSSLFLNNDDKYDDNDHGDGDGDDNDDKDDDDKDNDDKDDKDKDDGDGDDGDDIVATVSCHGFV